MARQRRISEKPVVRRRAVARGELALAPATVRAIRTRRVEKGDPVASAELAGLLAMKRTAELIPHCHIVPLTGSRVEVQLGTASARVEAEAEAVGRTGVEMEALVGATLALLTVWDMVKYLEKDAAGRYPRVHMDHVRVAVKEKRAVPAER
ncbi:MAG TPA: cyclic pyranopterin monophosphate synthase MoaC [Thermoplasmata archaeon]|nr:cyclic pyranopterin monophosphate synthase MoaC [Thermoplasmata archaeon]